jgi:hypothetical protein
MNVERTAENTRHVLEMRCEPLKKVRIGFIGLGMRVPRAIRRFFFIDGAEIGALCDVVPENLENIRIILKNNNHPPVPEYSGEEDWRKVCERDDLDLIYISTHYDLHTPIAVYAMQCGKHVAVEVPAATTVDESWLLVETAEQTRRHCVQLENCIYGRFELATFNMAQNGLLGELVHGEGAYIHDLRHLLFNTENGYWNMWRLKYHEKYNGNLYPTHGLGPVCHSMNIHRGDRLDYMVSMSSGQFGLTDYAQRNFGSDSDFANRKYANGDINTSLIHTANGKTIMLQHNIVSPRPYSRIHMLSGTRGMVQQWPEPGITLDKNGSDFLSKETMALLLKEYEHPLIKEWAPVIEENAENDAITKNGGMDYLMDQRLIYCLQNGLPPDTDVYDAAEWSAIMELSARSANNRSKSVDIPDFTRGAWQYLNQVHYYRSKAKQSPFKKQVSPDTSDFLYK